MEEKLQDVNGNSYPNEYECAKEVKIRKSKKVAVRPPKPLKWKKCGSRSYSPVGRYRGLSGSSAMDEAQEVIEHDLRQEELYFFDEKSSTMDEAQEVIEHVLRQKELYFFDENSPMKLFVDGLNYLDRFFAINRSKRAKGNIDFEKNLQKAQSKVEDFVKAAINSNISLEVFIDKSVATEETFLKWKSRREKEFYDGRDTVPPQPSHLLGELFRASGIKVHYSTVDCDDTIAAFAYHYGGNVLSNDSDFFRYTSRTTESSVTSRRQKHFKIFSNFQIKNGLLYLIPTQLRLHKELASQRIFLSPPPQTRTTGNFLDRPMQWEVEKHPEIYVGLQSMITRGNVSVLVRHFPNLHLTARPLRQAVYSRLGEKVVRERTCTWNFDKRKVEWVEENVFPDDTLDDILDNPHAAVQLLFSHETRPNNVSELAWRNHLFAQKIVVSSLCAWATGKPLLEIVKMCNVLMKKADEKAALAAQASAATKKAAEAAPTKKAVEASATKKAAAAAATKKAAEASATKKAVVAAATKKAAEMAATKKAAEASATKKAAEGASTKKAADAAPKKKAADAAPTKKAADAAPTKKAAETAATKKAVEASATKKAAEAAPTKKAAETAATKKAAEASATKKAAEKAATKKAAEASATKKAAEAAATKKAAEAATTSKVKCKSVVQYQSHLLGKQHAKKMVAQDHRNAKEINYQGHSKFSNAMKMTDQGHSNTKMMTIQGHSNTKKITDQDHGNAKKMTKKSHGNSKKLAAQDHSNVTLQDPNKAIKCDVCHVFVNSMKVLETHTRGKPHTANTKRLRMMPRKCSVCGIIVIGNSCLDCGHAAFYFID